MGRSIFGSSYPPGCSGPPEGPEPSPQSQDVWNILEAASVDESIIERVTKIVDELAEQAAADCSACQKRANEAEAEAEKVAIEYMNSLPLESVLNCSHGNTFLDCNACARADDLWYDAQRERMR